VLQFRLVASGMGFLGFGQTTACRRTTG
jgi:hypothetical protein